MYRVIIAEDEPKVSLLIQNLIQWEELGLSLVAVANDGISALSMIQKHRPDIVITDIRMPGYDGIELIGKAKQFDAQIDFVIISGYRHFDYAQKAIRFGVEDYLLKPLKAVEINQTLRKMIAKYGERELAKQLEKNYSIRVANDTKKLHEQFMTKLISHNKRSEYASIFPSSLDVLNRDYELDFKPELLQAFVVKADVHFESSNMNVYRLLSEKSLAVVGDALQGKCYQSILHLNEKGLYGIVNFSEAHRKPLRKALGAIIDELQSQSEIFDRIKVTIGLGHVASSINDMPESLCEAERAVANRLILGAGKIIERSEGANAPEIVSDIFSADIRADILKCLEVLDEAEMRSVVDKIAQLARTHSAISGNAILMLFEEFILIMRFGLKSQNAIDDWVESFHADISLKVNMCANQKDLFHILSDYAIGLVAHLGALRKSAYVKPIREAQKYMQENFSSAISLESISQLTGFNASYFSSLFKKETGMNFLDYLIELRIKEAKRLLSYPRKTIAEVAEEVGYSDVKHFSKLFTRITGLHPSQYRKLYY